MQQNYKQMIVTRQKVTEGTLHVDCISAEEAYRIHQNCSADTFERLFGGYLEVKFAPQIIK